MYNIKSISIANDGTMKRIAVTYDEIKDNGEVINANMRMNRIITDRNILDAVQDITDYAQAVLDEEE